MSNGRHIVLAITSTSLIALVTLVALELILRVADFRELRENEESATVGVDYDSELGWAPVPGSTGTIKSFRTTHYKHNSLGLRDEELPGDGKPTIVFVGDSFVWGLDSEADERFSDLLKSELPSYNILAAGASGYGTDQELLLLQRIWPKVKPVTVVLVFCAANDRYDNVRSRYFFNYYKPYFATNPDGSLVLKGQPVTRSHLLYYRDNWFVHRVWLARLAVNAYIRLMNPLVIVPDPSEKLVAKMREFVEGQGGKFMVAIQHHDEKLATHLHDSRVPFVKLEGADFIPEFKENVWGAHWTPEGQKDVARRILKMLTANGLVP